MYAPDQKPANLRPHKPSAWISQVAIRQAIASDLPGLEWEGAYTHFRRLIEDAYRRSSSGDAILWVAEMSANYLIGQLFVQLRSKRAELADGLRRAYIYSFRIRPGYRSGGLGTRMLDHAEGDLRRRDYSVATLYVGVDNPDAWRLYDRRGYQVTAAEPGEWMYIDHQGQVRQVREPSWRMEKRL